MPPLRRSQPNDPFDLINNRIADYRQRVEALRNNRTPTVPFYNSLNWPTNNVEGQIVVAGPTPLTPTTPVGPILTVADMTMFFPDGPTNYPDRFNDNMQILVVNLDGTERWLKLDYFHKQKKPVWNWNYTKIAFERHPVDNPSVDRDICIINPDGTGETVVLTGDYKTQGLQFSQDGTKLSFYNEDGLLHVVNIDGTNHVTNSGIDFSISHASDGPHWTTDGCLVDVWRVGYGSGPIPTYDIRKWNPATDEITIVFDVKAYATAHGYDILAPSGFGPVYGFDVNKDNILVIGWNNQVDTGYVSGVTPIYKQSGPTLCFIECVEGATPTFYNAEDMPDFGWEIHDANYGGSIPLIHQYPSPNQIFWSPDKTMIQWHNEVPVTPHTYYPNWHDWFREWQTLVAKASDPTDATNFWTFQFAPNGHLGTLASFQSYRIEDATPPNANDSYVPTWTWNNKVVMNGNNNTAEVEFIDHYEAGDPEGSGTWESLAIKGKAETPAWLVSNFYRTPYWDHSGHGPVLTTAPLVDDFNRGSLGSAWEVVSGSPSIASNKFTGAGIARYNHAATASQFAFVTIAELGATEYRLLCIDSTETTDPRSMGAFYDHDAGELGFFIRGEGFFGVLDEHIIYTSATLSAGDKLGVRQQGDRIWTYVQESGVWRTINNLQIYYVWPALSMKTKIGLEMTNSGGSFDDFHYSDTVPDPLVNTRYAPTGHWIQTWLSDQTHDF
jgi:hypothetical protein